jgi:site-specific DNA-methyltransferase (adenine-specific)
LANGDTDPTANRKLAVANWNERSFRSFLKELPYNNDTPCRTTMRCQVSAIDEIIERFADPQKKVTAAYCGEVAAKWAWFRKLLRDGFDRLSPDVELKDKKDVLKQIYSCKFGTKADERMHSKFIEYIDSLNQKVLRLWLVNGRAEQLTFIADDFVDVVITSPPYNLGKESWPMGGGGRESRDGIGYAAHDDTMDQAEYERWQIEVLKELYRVAKPGASFFYNHKVRTVDGCLVSPMRWLDHPDNPWTLRQEIIWNRKSTHNHAESLFWPIDERIYWMTKGKPVLTQPIGKSTIWEEFGPVPGTWHPAPFTEKLPQMLLDAVHIAPMSVVLDPFSGSGTTVKVALTYQCQAIGVDLTMDYLRKSAEANKWSEKCIYLADDIRLGGGDER